MIDLTKVRNYYIACGYTDLRLGIDGLAAVVTQQYGSNLDEESLFLFCGRRTDRIKALYWCGDGYILLYKRLSNGKFQWPRSEAELRLLGPRQTKMAGSYAGGRNGKTSKAAVGFRYCNKLFVQERKCLPINQNIARNTARTRNCPFWRSIMRG